MNSQSSYEHAQEIWPSKYKLDLRTYELTETVVAFSLYRSAPDKQIRLQSWEKWAHAHILTHKPSPIDFYLQIKRQFSPKESQWRNKQVLKVYSVASNKWPTQNKLNIFGGSLSNDCHGFQFQVFMGSLSVLTSVSESMCGSCACHLSPFPVCFVLSQLVLFLLFILYLRYQFVF